VHPLDQGLERLVGPCRRGDRPRGPLSGTQRQPGSRSCGLPGSKARALMEEPPAVRHRNRRTCVTSSAYPLPQNPCNRGYMALGTRRSRRAFATRRPASQNSLTRLQMVCTAVFDVADLRLCGARWVFSPASPATPT
jgi:hypothetical protein